MKGWGEGEYLYFEFIQPPREIIWRGGWLKGIGAKSLNGNKIQIHRGEKKYLDFYLELI